ncbi:MAG: glycosyltransferase [Acidimicrobiia bacterium]
MIQVLHVMARMAPGGTEHQLIGMLGSAHGRHWTSALCVLSSGWELTRVAKASGVPVFEIDGSSRLDVSRARRLRGLFGEVDVVHSSLPLANLFSQMLNRKRNGPALVVSERGVDNQRPPWMKLANRVMRSSTDAFVGNSPAVTSFIRKTYGLGPNDSRVFEVPNGIDSNLFYPAPSSHLDRPQRLLGIGRLIASKRFDRAISLLPRLNKATAVELILIGDGPERGRLELLAEGLPVTFLGQVSERRAVAQTLREADLLVMPSASEGYPNAVLEAIACGIPVVASDIPGIRPAAGPGVTLVEESDDAWYRAIVTALETGPILTPGLEGRVLSFDEVARRHLAVFWSALRRRGKAGADAGRSLEPQESR